MTAVRHPRQRALDRYFRISLHIPERGTNAPTGTRRPEKGGKTRPVRDRGTGTRQNRRPD